MVITKIAIKPLTAERNIHSNLAKLAVMLRDANFRRTARCSYYENFLSKKKIQSLPLTEIESHLINESKVMIKAEFNLPFVIKGTSPKLGIVLPPSDTTLTDVAEVIGTSTKINIIEVGQQNEITGYTLGEYANYLKNRTSAHKVINMISLEFSDKNYSYRVESPKFVRDNDWIDIIWPEERRLINEYPKVQKYCLSGMATSYTDFHIDFGGTSVWYSVVSGQKRFYLVPPTVENLLAFQSWSTSASQDDVFFGDLVPPEDLYIFDLYPGHTFMIPSGWIHAVYTPQDSLVFGGNFLHMHAILRQLQVYQVEAATRVNKQYRFPLFRQVNWQVLCALLPIMQELYPGGHGNGDDDGIIGGGGDSKGVMAAELLQKGYDPSHIEICVSMGTAAGSNLFDQLPLLVKVCSEWAVALTDEKEIAGFEWATKGTAHCESLQLVVDGWWTVLGAVAQRLDSTAAAATLTTRTVSINDSGSTNNGSGSNGTVTTTESSSFSSSSPSPSPSLSLSPTLAMSCADYLSFIRDLPSPVNLLDPRVVDRAMRNFNAEVDELYSTLGVEQAVRQRRKKKAAEEEANSFSAASATATMVGSTAGGDGQKGSIAPATANGIFSAVVPLSQESDALRLRIRMNDINRSIRDQRKTGTLDDDDGEAEWEDSSALLSERPWTVPFISDTAATTSSRNGGAQEPSSSSSSSVLTSSSLTESSYEPTGRRQATAATTHSAAVVKRAVDTVTSDEEEYRADDDDQEEEEDTSSSSVPLKFTFTRRPKETTASPAKEVTKTTTVAAARTVNPTRIKLTLAGVNSKPKKLAAVAVPKAPAPVNTVKIAQSSSSSSSSRHAALSDGQRKYGTRGLKLSAAFLQNAMDVDFLEQQQQEQEEDGDKEQEEQMAQMSEAGYNNVISSSAAAEGQSIAGGAGVGASASGGAGAGAVLNAEEMDVLFADDDDNPADEDVYYNSDSEDEHEEEASGAGKKSEFDFLDDDEEEEDEMDGESDFSGDEEDEGGGGRRGGGGGTRKRKAVSISASVATTGRRGSGGGGGVSGDKRKRNEPIAAAPKPAGFVVDRVSYNAYSGISNSTARPTLLSSSGSSMSSATTATVPQIRGKPIFSGSGGGGGGGPAKKKDVGGRSQILKKLGMKYK